MGKEYREATLVIHRPDMGGVGPSKPPEPTPPSGEEQQAAPASSGADVQALPAVTWENPGPITKAKRLIAALEQWRQAGLKRTPRAERKARDAACAVCPYLDPKGNWGWGECHAPGCGCTKFRNYLATSKCPHPEGSRWPA